jgi:hypothetical protein
MDKGYGGFGILWSASGAELRIGRHLWDFWKAR